MTEYKVVDLWGVKLKVKALNYSIIQLFKYLPLCRFSEHLRLTDYLIENFCFE